MQPYLGLSAIGVTENTGMQVFTLEHTDLLTGPPESGGTSNCVVCVTNTFAPLLACGETRASRLRWPGTKSARGTRCQAYWFSYII